MIISYLLVLEMRSPIYLPATSNIRFAYNAIAKNLSFFIDTWPFALDIKRSLDQVVTNPQMAEYIWEFVSVPLWISFNSIGIPLLMATAWYFTSKSAHQEFSLFSFLILWMSLLSVPATLSLSTDYDRYSLGGQIMYHIRWYLFPLSFIPPWMLYKFLSKQWRISRLGWLSMGLGLLAIGLMIRPFFPFRTYAMVPSAVVRFPNISEDTMLTMKYLHDRTPSTSVVQATSQRLHDFFFTSSHSGRAVYSEDRTGADELERLSAQQNPESNREGYLKQLWTATNDQVFCQLLNATPINYVIEDQTQSFSVRESTCMAKLWTSPQKEFVIWQVKSVN